MARTGVLVVTFGFHPQAGGAERALLRLSRCLIERGVPVTVISPRLDPRWPSREVLDGIQIVRPLHPRIPILGALIFQALLALSMVWRAPGCRWVVVNAVSFHTVTALMVARVTRTLVGLRLQSSGYHSGFQLVKKQPFGDIVGKICLRVDRFFATSTTIRDELCARGVEPGRIALVPNGVQMPPGIRRAAGQASLAVPMGRVVSLGRLVEPKRLDRLVDAWGQVHQQDWDIPPVLEIHGDGPERQALGERIRAAGLEDVVHFAGHTHDPRSVLDQADIFVLSSAAEGMPNSLLEAMAAGLAVVSTRVSGALDVLDHDCNGILVDEPVVDSLAEALVRLLRDPKLVARLGQQARETIESGYTVEHMTDRWLAALDVAS